jgi:hypothetical protein
MTLIGHGGVSISTIETTSRFDKDYSKLDRQLKELVGEKLPQLLLNPMPTGLRFENSKAIASHPFTLSISPEITKSLLN